ncbi:hypothetical protein ACL02O_31650 [Micromonospora sp. MS34]|uniref:hypothetical protein n=1 Tax=Micromonospora sp. MS34 TaxID=3385971 RepID=UPI0039A289E4
MRVHVGGVGTLLAVAFGATACVPEPAPPAAAPADLAGGWCAAPGDRLDLDAGGSARLSHVSDGYLAHLLTDLRETWSDEYVQRTYFGGRRPSSAQGTWLSATDDGGWSWVRVSFGVREAAADRDPQSPARFRFRDALRVERDEHGLALAAYDDGSTENDAAAWFTPCPTP